jgi:mannose-6-phosphate isomerase-like protein (cupin superfamily)
MKVTFKDSLLVKPNSNTFVHSYPSHNPHISIAHIEVHGRHPDKKNQLFIEKKCHVMLYVLKGEGKAVIEGVVFQLKATDSVVIESGKQYYVEGSFEYLAVTSPAYSPEQNEVVEI